MSAIMDIKAYRLGQLSQGKVPVALTLRRSQIAEIVRELRSCHRDRSGAPPKLNLKSGNISLYGIRLCWPEKK